MNAKFSNHNLDRLIASLGRLANDQHDQLLIAKTIQSFNTRYDLGRKIENEPGVEEILTQMFGRLAVSYGNLSDIQNKSILDIACGSNTSKMPALLHIKTPFGKTSFSAKKGYTALFEPWFCRILFEVGATPVGVDFGDLDQESFVHHHVDLGKIGALDFLPDRSFDGIQDSRLFGSPEFTAQFPDQAERLKVAQEIVRQEQRLLKIDGIIIHSDAAARLS
jgi:hypothetical protein